MSKNIIGGFKKMEKDAEETGVGRMPKMVMNELNRFWHAASKELIEQRREETYYCVRPGGCPLWLEHHHEYEGKKKGLKYHNWFNIQHDGQPCCPSCAFGSKEVPEFFLEKVVFDKGKIMFKRIKYRPVNE